jgi:hypothetical protein
VLDVIANGLVGVPSVDEEEVDVLVPVVDSIFGPRNVGMLVRPRA